MAKKYINHEALNRYIQDKPEKSVPKDETDELMLRAISACIETSEAKTLLEVGRTRYGGESDFQRTVITKTDLTGLAVEFPADEEMRKELHKSARKAYSHKAGEYGTKHMLDDCNRYQSRPEELARQAAVLYEEISYSEDVDAKYRISHNAKALARHIEKFRDCASRDIEPLKAATSLFDDMISDLNGGHKLLFGEWEVYNDMMRQMHERKRDRTTSELIRYCDSFGLRNYCQKLLTKYNLDI